MKRTIDAILVMLAITVWLPFAVVVKVLARVTGK